MSWWPLTETRIAIFLQTVVCAGALVVPLRASSAAETGFVAAEIESCQRETGESPAAPAQKAIALSDALRSPTYLAA